MRLFHGSIQLFSQIHIDTCRSSMLSCVYLQSACRTIYKNRIPHIRERDNIFHSHTLLRLHIMAGMGGAFRSIPNTACNSFIHLLSSRLLPFRIPRHNQTRFLSAAFSALPPEIAILCFFHCIHSVYLLLSFSCVPWRVHVARVRFSLLRRYPLHYRTVYHVPAVRICPSDTPPQARLSAGYLRTVPEGLQRQPQEPTNTSRQARRASPRS